MALPSSGNPLSFSQINTELGRSSNAQISMGETAVRSLFGRSSGEIGMNHGLGKSSAFVHTATISTSVANYDQRAAAVAAGWDQVKPLRSTVTITGTGVVYSSSTGSYAYSTGTSFPAGSTLTLINGGYIVGKGGTGGNGGAAQGATGGAGSSGGPALYAGYPISITNNGYIGGGGGGGGGGGVG